MSNLIVTIISIALVAVAAVMGVFYGGTAFSGSSVSAYATQTINVMQQIKTAYTMAQLNGDTSNFYNNKQYLNLPYYNTYGSFNINYGSNGNVLDWGCSGTNPPPLSGTAANCMGTLNIVTDSSGKVFVLWYIDNANNTKFYAQLCYTLNKQMGGVPYASNLTLSNFQGVTAYPVPVYNVYGNGTYLQNLCNIDTNYTWRLFFAIPI